MSMMLVRIKMFTIDRSIYNDLVGEQSKPWSSLSEDMKILVRKDRKKHED